MRTRAFVLGAGIAVGAVALAAPAAFAQSGPDNPPPAASEPAPPPPPAPQPAPPPVSAPPPARPIKVVVMPPPEADARPATGVALELGLQTTLTNTGSTTSTGTTLSLPSVQPTLFVGYRLRRVSFGVTLDLARFDQNMSTTTAGTTTSMDTNQTAFQVMPGVRVSLLDSADHRTELLATLDLGYVFQFQTPSSMTSIDEYVAQVGVGVRRWIAPSFAVGANAGISYDVVDTSSTPQGTLTNNSESESVTAVYVAFQIIAVL